MENYISHSFGLVKHECVLSGNLFLGQNSLLRVADYPCLALAVKLHRPAPSWLGAPFPREQSLPCLVWAGPDSSQVVLLGEAHALPPSVFLSSLDLSWQQEAIWYEHCTTLDP